MRILVSVFDLNDRLVGLMIVDVDVEDPITTALLLGIHSTPDVDGNVYSAINWFDELDNDDPVEEDGPPWLDLRGDPVTALVHLPGISVQCKAYIVPRHYVDVNAIVAQYAAG